MKIHKLLGLIACLFCLLACNKDDETNVPAPIPTPTPSAPTITIDKSIVEHGLTFTNDASDISITFTTDADWTLSVSETRSVDWCTPSVVSGTKGIHTIKFSVTENCECNNREATVTIKSGSTSIIFTIFQRQKDAIILSKTEYLVSSEEEMLELDLQTNIMFEIYIDVDWVIQVDEPATRALKEDVLYLRVAQNTTGENRYAEVVITDKEKNLSQSVRIIQTAMGKIALMVDGRSFNKILYDLSGWTEKITSIDFLVNDKSTPINNCKLLSSEDSYYPIYGMYNNGKVTIFTEGDRLVFPSDCSYMFYYCCSIDSLDFSNIDTSNVTDMSNMFSCCEGLSLLDLSCFNTSNVTNMSSLFYECYSLSSLNLSSFDTSNVTNMSNMFNDCINLRSLNLSNFATRNVEDMNRMFVGCEKLISLDLSNFDTSNVKDMSAMFYRCNKLTSLDLSNFDTSNVTKIGGMFGLCKSLTTLDLSDFDTSNVVDMSNMFWLCSNLSSVDLSSFKTLKVTKMKYTFENCTSLLSIDLSNFDTSNVIDMSWMFSGCNSLTSLKLDSFAINELTYCRDMFSEIASKSRDCTIAIPEDSYQWVKDQLSESYFKILHP